MKIFYYSIFFIFLLSSLCACRFNKKNPENETVHSFYNKYKRKAQQKIASLKLQRSLGRIDDTEYEFQLREINQDIAKKTSDAIYRQYRYNQTTRAPANIGTLGKIGSQQNNRGQTGQSLIPQRHGM